MQSAAKAMYLYIMLLHPELSGTSPGSRFQQ
jgi:hypothetical protein